MGLKTLVKADLKRRGLGDWTKKAPQATPNKKASASLAARQRGHVALVAGSKNPEQYTQPGSYTK